MTEKVDIYETRGEAMAASTMEHWWPRLQTVDVPVPETVQIGCEEQKVGDGSLTCCVPDKGDVVEAVEEVGGPPAFLRSDETSCKHKMLHGSKIGGADPAEIRLGGLVEAHFGFGAPDPSSYYVREWLDLWHLFRSFGDSATPVACEVRTFLYDGELHDAGFYWPENSIWEHAATEDNWPALLEETRERAFDDAAVWEAHAEAVAQEFDTGYWSVDFAMTSAEEWYCIDMARGEVSWHPDAVDPPDVNLT